LSNNSQNRAQFAVFSQIDKNDRVVGVERTTYKLSQLSRTDVCVSLSMTSIISIRCSYGKRTYR
jgi:hypothetical protein